MKKLIFALVCMWVMVPAAVFAADGFIAEGTVLKKDSKGPEVRLLQQALKIAGHFDAVAAPDNFGDATEKAVKDFQSAVQMTADGIAGKATFNKLSEKGYIPILKDTVYKFNNTYADLPALQAALHSEGLYTGAFGQKFDEKTLNAVKAFQAKYTLTADGVAGQGTIGKLISLGYISSPAIVSAGTEGIAVTRGNGKRNGAPINWYDIKPKFTAGKTVVTVEDFKTGITFKVQVSYAATVHADVETLTVQDSETVKKLWGGYSWDRRPVLVHFNGEVYAASMNGLPHAGVDSKPEGATVSGRSADYGSGYNFDDIKGNGIDGHFCLHFLGSRTHGGNKLDEKHQANVRIAAGQ